MTVARRLSIHGRVQGVFYRVWSVEAARDLGLAGWVRNRRDGSVEAFVQGDEPAINRFVALAKEGPARANVDRIESIDAEPDTALTDFSQRQTA